MPLSLCTLQPEAGTGPQEWGVRTQRSGSSALSMIWCPCALTKQATHAAALVPFKSRKHAAKPLCHYQAGQTQQPLCPNQAGQLMWWPCALTKPLIKQDTCSRALEPLPSSSSSAALVLLPSRTNAAGSCKGKLVTWMDPPILTSLLHDLGLHSQGSPSQQTSPSHSGTLRAFSLGRRRRNMTEICLLVSAG